MKAPRAVQNAPTLRFFLAYALPEGPPEPPPTASAKASWQRELPPETDSLPVWEGSWSLKGGHTPSQSAEGLWLDQTLWATEPIGTPALSADNSRVVFTRRDPVPAVQGELVASQAPSWDCRVVAHGDRAAISPDGTQIAWVDVETTAAVARVDQGCIAPNRVVLQRRETEGVPWYTEC